MSTMAENNNQLEYLKRYVTAFEKNTRVRFEEQGLSPRETNPMMLDSLYKMYGSLNLDYEEGLDEENAKKIFDQVCPGFINYAKRAEKGTDNKRDSFLKSLFVGNKKVENRPLGYYKSYGRVDMER